VTIGDLTLLVAPFCWFKPFAFCCFTEEAIWFFRDNHFTRWNATVRLRSSFIRTGSVSGYIRDALRSLDIEPTVTSVSRCDICCDFSHPDLDHLGCSKPACRRLFIAPPNTHIEPYFNDQPCITGVEIGKVSGGRQVAWYSKTLEAITKGTLTYWCGIWRARYHVWRVECRAYRKTLAKWSVTDLRSLKRVLADIVASTMAAIRYRADPVLWQRITAAMLNYLASINIRQTHCQPGRYQ
jgi:hypothetical protein